MTIPAQPITPDRLRQLRILVQDDIGGFTNEAVASLLAALDQSARTLGITQRQLGRVRQLAASLQRLAIYLDASGADTPDVAMSLRYHADQLVRALDTGTPRPEAGPERCAHCGKPRNGLGIVNDGAKVCHTGTLPPYAHPADCYRLVTVHGEALGCRDLRNFRDKLADRLVDEHLAAHASGERPGDATPDLGTFERLAGGE